MGGSFRVARLAGIDIKLHLSWFAVLALVAWTLAEGVFPDQYEGWSSVTYWILGSIAAVLLFVTVLIHELAHALVAVRRGLPVPEITLFIFGGVSHLGEQPRSSGEEFAIAAAGPLTSFAIALVTGVLGALLAGVSEHATAILTYLATVNVLLGVFNLLPGFPLDGGRVLRSVAWRRTGSFRRATQIAAGSGTTVGYGLMIVGAVWLLAGSVLSGIWFMFIGWFLLGAARSEAQGAQIEAVLARLLVRDVMRSAFATVSPSESVQSVVDTQMLGAGERVVIVAQNGGVAGILSVTDLKKVSRSAWGSTTVQGLMTPRDRVVTVASNAPASEALRYLAEHNVHQLPVLESGRLVGLVTRGELIERLQLVRTLTDDGPA